MKGLILLSSILMSLFLIPCAEGQQKSSKHGNDSAATFEISFDANGGNGTPSPIKRYSKLLSMVI